MIQMEFDSSVIGGNNTNNHLNTASALTDSNNPSTPFSVKDILNFVDQSEQQQIVFVDCGSFSQESPSTSSTMDYCDPRNNSVESPPQYLYHHHHHYPATAQHYYNPHHHHHTAAATTTGAAASPQFGYSDLCDYNANYYSTPYTPNTYYGHSANYPYPANQPTHRAATGAAEFQQVSSDSGLEMKSSPVDFMHSIQQTSLQSSPSKSSASLLSPHAQQLDTMCQELSAEDNESRSRKF